MTLVGTHCYIWHHSILYQYYVHILITWLITNFLFQCTFNFEKCKMKLDYSHIAKTFHNLVSLIQTPSSLTRTSLLSNIYLICFIYTFIYWQFYVFHCTGNCHVSYPPIRRLCCGPRSSDLPQGSSAFWMESLLYHIILLFSILLWIRAAILKQVTLIMFS